MKIRKNKLDHEEDTATSQGRSSSSNIPYNWRLRRHSEQTISIAIQVWSGIVNGWGKIIIRNVSLKIRREDFN